MNMLIFFSFKHKDCSLLAIDLSLCKLGCYNLSSMIKFNFLSRLRVLALRELKQIEGRLCNRDKSSRKIESLNSVEDNLK
jgi:hypothetical protein